ncbi:TonB family protein [Larkinella soli]|uniref:TonB family protein n=1 Tax=Larkinella soli TaxID=1770527 RepID=UPI000FFCB6EE|nr:energy transducer TonB [Larkinella soli]
MTSLFSYFARRRHQLDDRLTAWVFGPNPAPLVTPFFHSSTLKQRILMLQKSKSGRWRLVSYGVVFPLAVLLLMCTQKEAEPTQAAADKATEKAVAQGLSALSRIGPVGEVYTVVDDLPGFPGGWEALGEYLSDHLNYPEKAVKDGVQGKVFVTFIVATDGSLHDAQILEGLSPEVNAEALRVVYDMPHWTPGRIQGKPVNVKFRMPIRFQL